MILLEELCRLAKYVEAGSERWQERNESETRRALVVPFIDALGYDTGNPREVKEEFQIGDSHVDYAIKQGWQPAILVEAKPANSDLSKHWTQLHDYFKDANAPFALLTNGIEYKFYADLKQAGHLDYEPFLSFDLRMDFRFGDEDDEILANDLRWFTKTDYDPKRILVAARRHALIPLLTNEMQQPSVSLVRFFAEQITNDNWETSGKLHEYSEALKEAWREVIKREISGTKTVGSDAVEIDITAEYRGSRFNATLLLTESLKRTGNNVVFENAEMNYQEATNRAIRSVNSEESFVSGWDFWRFIDLDTIEELPLKRLFFDEETRKRIRSQIHRR